MKILSKNEDKINWFSFSLNKNPEAIEIMRKNLMKINIHELSRNEGIFKKKELDEEIKKEIDIKFDIFISIYK